MRTAFRWPLAAVAVLACAALVVVLLRDGSGTAPGPGGVAPEAVVETPEPVPVRTADAGDATGEREPIRSEVSPTPDAPGAAHGVRGRVVDEAGSPVADAVVHLFASHRAQDLQMALVLQRKEVVVPPVAQARTDQAGRFELGVRTVGEGGYDIVVVSRRHPPHTVPNVTLFDGRFVEIDDVVLPRSLTVVGRVTVQGSHGFPIPDARVTLEPSNLRATFNLAPGHENGLEVRTDAAGGYRFDNVAAGFVTVTAVAPGFARVERLSVDVRPDVENRVDFELPRGHSIAGTVVATDGAPVANARIDAALLDARNRLEASAISDAAGHFEVLGLVDGAYRLVVFADGYVRGERKPVRAGARDERLVIQPQSSVALRVEGGEGPLTRYDALLRLYHAEQDTIGHVPTAQVQAVLPRDVEDGWFRIPDVDPGTYVVQVEADGYARSFSEPFEVAPNAPEVRVELAMSRGGALTGRVVGPDGAPVADAQVETLPGFVEDGPLAEVMGRMVPHRTTRAVVRTQRDGTFTLPRLAAGEYQLRIEHPHHSTLRLRELPVADGETHDLGDLQLVPGAEIRGKVMLDGAPAGQIKVAITSIPDPTQPNAPSVHTEAVTADDGTFVLPRRLPPGEYQARAARQTLPNPILQVVDYQKTRQEFAIQPGQTAKELHFSMTSD